MLEKAGHVVRRFVGHVRDRTASAIRTWTRPHPDCVVLGVAADLVRSKRELVVENALLRQQLIVLRRQVNRPKCTPADRIRLVLLAGIVRSWKDALLLVKPDTILRWHRAGFRLLWRRKSRAKRRSPRIPFAVVELIRDVAKANLLWGAERIRGELLKLGLRVGKRTIQRYLRRFRPPRRPSQRWATFVRNHANQMWACDFLQAHDILFRPIFAFFVIEVGSRKVIQVDVTRSPSRAWTAQQLRNATPWGQGSRFLIRNNGDKFGPTFDGTADAIGTKILRTPVRAPKANAV